MHTLVDRVEWALALTLLLFTIHVAPVAPTSTAFDCRCRPWDDCWPSPQDWSHLNASLNGHVVGLRPVSAACHEPNVDQVACDVVRQLNSNSSWRAAQPGALVNELWECGLESDECCDSSQKGQPCHQGRIPLYSAVVESAQEVQTAVKFAQKHNLRLIIQNTGHDAAGASSGPHSFQISTSRLKDIQYHENFRLMGSSTGPAVSFGAGVLFHELYAQGKQKGFAIPGGDSATVGVAGGFVQGGGVPDYLGYAWGLAADNVLECQVVTASGELVIAHKGQHPDLFWALRGGGGGTFGVVIRVTMKAYPDSPAVKTTISAQGDGPLFWSRDIGGLLTALQSLNRQGIAGVFRLMPISTGFIGAIDVCFLNQTTVEDGDRLVNTALGSKSTASRYNVSSTVLDSLSADFDTNDPPANVLFGSMLVSQELFHSTGGPRQIAARMARIGLNEGENILTSNLGGRVSDSSNRLASPLHPAWGSSAHLVSLMVNVGSTPEARHRAMKRLSNELMPALYSLDPSQRVSYRNMGDPNQPDSRDVYWGRVNYDHLSRIKRAWDPMDLFISRLGIGSDRWDSEGLCRV